AGLVAPVAGFALSHNEQNGDAQRRRDPGQALDVEKPKQGHGRASVSSEAPSRVAATLNRPTGPPVSRPTITATIAAMKPRSDQPKMMTIECSSAADQPPHISSATMATAQAPQNTPAAAASRP